MNRRTFVRNGATALCLLPVFESPVFARLKRVAPADKPTWLLELIKGNDQQLITVRALRITDTANLAFGGLKDNDDIPNPQTTADFVRRASCAMSCPESEHYRSKALLEEIDVALKYLLKVQHFDGTLDLPATNFHSTPDTGFIVKRLTTGYSLLSKSGTPAMDGVLATFKSFLLKAGEALVVGGIHTPNHRWVVSAALAKLNTLWPDARYVARVDQWLSEHIDMDVDGQYNERSTLIYSPLTNRLLITIAKNLNKPYLLDYVRRNLAMTLHYVHPNGELVTEASGRQDKAGIGTPEGYWYAYRYIALLDKNGEMAAMCRQIEKTLLPKSIYYVDYFLDDPAIWRELPPSQPLPTNYVRAFPKSGLVRIRRGDWDSTILQANPVWLTFHKGNAILQGLRIAASFFGKGQFQTETIDKQGDTWILTQSLDGPYYQTYPPETVPADGDWEKMLRSNRKQSEIQRLQTRITIREVQRGIEATIQMTGTNNVPVALELIFRPGGNFTGVTKHPNRDNAYLVSNSGSYTVQSDTITFGPGLQQHKNVQLRGSLPAMDAPTVYLTGFTPFQHTITLT
ncbi:hypothetical protein IC229_06545 [Spirosoma sp. BT702]|uniref:Uncharacterized protein n=1 Tax=Spirosoma profusum TaxID=2771354 RepID=A0A926XUI5_9BACT|nr:hypothetical protein [Spirosoma profusum]MBD2700284.1 hypothetical protein [Spirosoma profusum]